MGGKSSSSTDQAQTTLSADGVVTGSVVNISAKRDATYIQEFPETVADVMSQLIQFADKSFTSALYSSDKALSSGIQAAQQSAQPDLTILKEGLKFLPILIVGIVLIAGVVVWKR